MNDKYAQDASLKVQIKNKYLESLPFGKLESRYGIAIMLSFYGDNEEVYRLMQIVNHKARAYIVNTEGLKPFLKVSQQIIRPLRKESKIEE